MYFRTIKKTFCSILFFLLSLTIVLFIPKLLENLTLPPNLPVDYGNYLHGIKTLALGQNPYSQIEFFSPPWIAFFLAPFYLLYYPFFWQIFCIFCSIQILFLTNQELNNRFSKKQSKLTPIFLFFLPTTLFSIILGQLSSLIGLVILLLYLRIIDRKVHHWEIAFGIALLTLKPHVVFLPAIFLGLEFLRRENWKIISISIATIVFLGIASSMLLYKDWLPSLFNAIFVGQKYIGGADLAASFHKNFTDIGIPVLVFIPHLVYALYLWLKKGLTFYFFLFVSALNFLLMPYTRQYDFVVLLPVYFYIFSKLLYTRHHILLILFAITLFFLPFYTQLSFLIPAITLGLLLLFPDNSLDTKYENHTI